jgi:Spy/CpxP family protein refolding chaperone
MRATFVTTGILCALAAASIASDGQSPYTGLGGREIKALSVDSIEAYRNGEGMGYAMAAELNSYPGPKHVLELAEPLGLSAEQREATTAAFEAMHAEAVRLGEEIVGLERRMDALFASGEMDESRLRALVAEAGRLQGELRYAHLRAHLTMRSILTAEQVATYDRLRGYERGGEAPGAEECPHGDSHEGPGPPRDS